MSDSVLGRLRQSSKAAFLSFMVLVGITITELVLIDRALVDPRLVILLPILICTPSVWIYAHLVMRYRIHGLSDAFVAISNGQLDTVLPPSPDAEITHIRDAFERMAQALREMTDRLRKTDATRRQLFADLAHELGTPTATVVALADALALPEIEASPERRAELVDALVGEGVRLSRLVTDIRDLAELDDPDVALRRSPSDLAPLVEDAAHRLELAHPDAAPIAVHAPDSLVADVDPERIEQVLMNVLVNAQRYTPADRGIDVRLHPCDEGLRLEIEDGGPGVDDETLQRLGERLYRADRSRSRGTGGSGLGLSIVRAIVERHGGALQFARGGRGGLLVRIELPEGPASAPRGSG